MSDRRFDLALQQIRHARVIAWHERGVDVHDDAIDLVRSEWRESDEVLAARLLERRER